MMSKPNVPIIAIEEHYWDAELAKTFQGPEAGRPGDIHTRLHDFDNLRIKEMDEAGIDIQVLHNTLWIEQVTQRPDVEAALCRSWNRWLAEVWQQSQGRLRWSWTWSRSAMFPSSAPSFRH